MKTPANISVFIVEDHDITRLGLVYSLQEVEGISVCGMCNNGLEALKQIEALSPHVVLMDIRMPGLDGIQVTNTLKNAGNPAKIVMFTSYGDTDEVMAAVSSGADAYCLKECTQEQLITAIHSVVNGAFWLHPGIARTIFMQQKTPETESLANGISSREQEILLLIAQGASNAQIAEKLGLGIETVKSHIRRILHKLRVNDRTQAAVKAVKDGIVSIE